MNGPMVSPQMKAGMRPRGSVPANWVPSRMTTNLSRRWPGLSAPLPVSSVSSPSTPERQLTGYGGRELVIESTVRTTGYVNEQPSKSVKRQLTGYSDRMVEHVVESTSNGTLPQASSNRAQPSVSSHQTTPAASTANSSYAALHRTTSVAPAANSSQVAAPAANSSPAAAPAANSSSAAAPAANSSSAAAPAASPSYAAAPAAKSSYVAAHQTAPATPTINSSHAASKKEDDSQPKSSCYKFTYFNLRARGEVSRLLFAAAGQKYENVIFEAPPDFQLTEFWSAREQNPEKYPYGQLPILEVDGQTIAQSHAIERFIADRFGLLGKSGSVERAQIDAVIEHCIDIFNKFTSHVFSPNKDELILQHYNDYFPMKCDFLEALLQKNGTGWMVGDSMTLADIAVYQNVLMTGVPDYVRQSLEGYNPLLLALGEKVESNAGIAKWLQERPDTFF